MRLNEDQKEQLRSLVNHPWFRIWEMIEEDARNKLWQKLLEVDLNNSDHLKIIKENQTYVKARKDFMINIKTNMSKIYNPLDKLL